MLDEILNKFGLKYEDLEPDEMETLNVWMDALQKGQVNVSKVREYVTAMKESVEQALTKSNLKTKKDLFLKARLKNYLLLELFLSTPEKVKKQMESALSNIAGKKVS